MRILTVGNFTETNSNNKDEPQRCIQPFGHCDCRLRRSRGINWTSIRNRLQQHAELRVQKLEVLRWRNQQRVRQIITYNYLVIKLI